MRKSFRRSILFCAVMGVAATMVSDPRAHATGYDKSVLVSGKHGGVANAVTSSVGGAESLFFNPAGLALGAGTESKGDGTLNFSPSTIRFKGPITASGTQATSKSTFLPIAGLQASYRPAARFGYGAGISAAGGSVSNYGEVDFSSLGFSAFKPTVKGDLRIYEFALGAGYEVSPGFRVGAAWRVSRVQAELSSASAATGALVEAQLKELTATNFTGFRVGAQVAPRESKWGLGLSVRTPVEFTVKGKGEGRIESPLAPGVVTNISSSDVSAKSKLPLAISAGGHWDFCENWRGLLDYSWLNYSTNRFIDIAGTLTDASGATSVPLPDTAQAWKNAHVIRVGFEYKGIENWPLRAGFVYGSPVVAKSTAQAIFETPGSGYDVTLGTGTTFMERKLEANLALNYNWGRAEVASSETNGNLSGRYAVDAYALHTGVTYRF